jgi:hypothetical protein
MKANNYLCPDCKPILDASEASQGSSAWAWWRMRLGDTVSREAVDGSVYHAWFIENDVIMERDTKTGTISASVHTIHTWIPPRGGYEPSGWFIYEKNSKPEEAKP